MKRVCFLCPSLFYQISGISKVGKEFFKFNTQLTESITKVHVFEKSIWSSAEYVHNEYLEGKDKAFFLCPDRINDAEVSLVVLPAEIVGVRVMRVRVRRFYEQRTRILHL